MAFIELPTSGPELQREYFQQFSPRVSVAARDRFTARFLQVNARVGSPRLLPTAPYFDTGGGAFGGGAPLIAALQGPGNNIANFVNNTFANFIVNQGGPTGDGGSTTTNIFQDGDGVGPFTFSPFDLLTATDPFSDSSWVDEVNVDPQDPQSALIATADRAGLGTFVTDVTWTGSALQKTTVDLKVGFKMFLDQVGGIGFTATVFRDNEITTTVVGSTVCDTP